MKKTKVSVGQKVIKLREEQELLERFLIIHQTRPELVPKLEDTIVTYPGTALSQTQVLIVDAVAVMQCMRKTSSVKTLYDLQNAFVKCVECMMLGYSDRYVDNNNKSSKSFEKSASLLGG